VSRCFDGGYIGGTHLAIPDDLARFRKDFNDRVGCNRLHCPTCDSFVRHLDGYRASGALDAAAKQALYDSAAPESLPSVYRDEATREGRLYFCRCTVHTEFGLQTVDSTDYGWSCGGHPLP